MADTARLSLLDVVQEGQGHDRDKASRCTRCIYVARRCGDTTGSTLLEAIHREALESSCRSGACAGLLLLFPKCLLHVLEVEDKKLVPCLRALQVMGGTAQLQGIKVISSTDDVPCQLFSQWHVGFMNHDCKDQHEGLDPNVSVQTASAINNGCVQTAKELEIMSEARCTTALNSQQETLLSSWASPESILALTYTEGVPTIQEYLTLFDGAISATLNSECTWPL